MGRQDRVDEARQVLRDLGFDAERSNERSALVLLALIQIVPNGHWIYARDPMLRTVEIMDWVGAEYGKVYRPNTRETIRRQTLHQFRDAGLVLQNPDDPSRAINSPKNCYRLAPAALKVLRAFGSPSYDEAKAAYLDAQPGLRSMYAAAREQELLPVTLVDGSVVELTPGGQNVLLKDMVEQFCARWTPGARVLYIGDAGRDDPIYEEHALEELGVRLDKHGKLPDLIVFLPDRNWLVLMEAASSHGPVDAKRHGELSALFGASSAGLVFVSCFSSRGEMRKYLADIAWETDAWCAQDPSHLIHFNGERFLGPYKR